MIKLNAILYDQGFSFNCYLKCFVVMLIVHPQTVASYWTLFATCLLFKDCVHDLQIILLCKIYMNIWQLFRFIYILQSFPICCHSCTLLLTFALKSPALREYGVLYFLLTFLHLNKISLCSCQRSLMLV